MQMNLLKKFTDKLFSTTISGVYILLFAIAIGIATFIENDFGTSSAQNVIFKTWWFELLLILFAVITSYSIHYTKLYDRLMKDLANKFPIYFWEQNKGYPTSKHREIIKLYGPSPFHRKSFLKNILSEQEITEYVNAEMKA